MNTKLVPKLLLPLGINDTKLHLKPNKRKKGYNGDGSRHKILKVFLSQNFENSNLKVQYFFKKEQSD